MELEQLIEGLARPEAFAFDTEPPEIVHTHISVVFLAGEHAFKVKRPVDLGFLDFTTLEARRHFCDEEVRLNRRLAPDVYLGVVPITLRGEQLVFGGDGPAVEYAVHMRRLPDDRTFEAFLEADRLDDTLLVPLAERMSAFHAKAASGPDVSRWGGFDTVAGNAHENFEQVEPYVGETISEPVFERLRNLVEADLERHRVLMDERAARHRTRDTHGDLHLKHVYSLDDDPGDGLLVVDCIEFNERFRFADPVADIAFLAMDLTYRGRPDLAHTFCEAYFDASGDDEGRGLLAYYTGYRAMVRGKVDGFAWREPEIPMPAREAARDRARAYFLLALGVVAAPVDRPALVLSIGLPGTGKSWLARQLEQRHGFHVVSTDNVRKELAGFEPTESAAAPVDEGIYAPDWSDRTYDACLDRAVEHLKNGDRVVVDATFRASARRICIRGLVLRLITQPKAIAATEAGAAI